MSSQENLVVKKLSMGPFDNNCYILRCSTTGESIIVDAPSEPSLILKEAEGTTIRMILITHNHGDHWGALAELREKSGAPVAAHPADAPALPVPVEILLADGQELAFGQVQAKVIHTPGHTPGSVCLLAGNHLISGDTLFPGGPGRTRTPANLDEIIGSITKKLFSLPDDTLVHPGHGADTILRKEKEEYAVFAQKSHEPNLCGDVSWLSS